MRADFQEILFHPHHISAKRMPMSKSSRAAKFSAFKALEGHEDMISEEGRLTDNIRNLTEDESYTLNEQLQILLQHEYEEVKVKVHYFKPDSKKNGGEYVDYIGTFKYYRADLQNIVFTDNREININSVAGVEILTCFMAEDY